ncbi:hypothetical protein F5X68DRAFT_78719 [Plectosphaerella plurivora]|uniref:DSBA-like thioredoxin domain-containing protein n=1 Tax=Plectosphaerella plurivora TaxID=936078 RepID=A0A9P9ACI2_9PEZI|nr:hypothetical protein F5X68DRAFT_78719 [Plectosphaerella plurivora]
MVRIRIEVLSDTLCPWCYIGKKHLDQAIHLFRQKEPNAVFEVEWKPCYTFPNLAPIPGQPKRVLIDRYPLDIQHKIMQAGIRAGISFRLDEGTTGPSTASHTLLRLALQYFIPAASPSPTASARGLPSGSGYYQGISPGRSSSSSPGIVYSPPIQSTQSRLLDALFAAHCERGLDISSPNLLVALAEECGVPYQDAQRILADNAALQETEFEALQNSTRAKGHPTFFIQDQWEVGGVAEPEVFVEVFEKAAQKERQRRGMSLREMLIDEDAL